jgi:hypothetical protein
MPLAKNQVDRDRLNGALPLPYELRIDERGA